MRKIITQIRLSQPDRLMLAPSPPFTAIYHGAEDAALRILPAVDPMCIDPVGDVRSSALQVCGGGEGGTREL